MASATLVWPRVSRKAAGANFMSPAKDLDPERGRLRKLAWLQADLTLALANASRAGANAFARGSSNSTGRSARLVLLLRGGTNETPD
jgi:hypothetical protein